MEKSKTMMLIIMVLLLALLGTVVGVTFYILNMLQSAQTDPDAPPPVQYVRELTPDDITKIPLGDSITTNVTGPDKSYILNANMSIGFDNTTPDTAERLERSLRNNMDLIRSIVLSIVLRNSYDDLIQPEAKDLIAEQIRIRLSDEFRTNLIIDIYITDWILL